MTWSQCRQLFDLANGWHCMCKDRWNWMSTSEEQKEKVLRLARKLMRQEGIRTGQSLWASRYDTKIKTTKNGISIPDERAAGNGRAELNHCWREDSDWLHLKAGLILYASERLVATLHQGLMNIEFRESLWCNVVMNWEVIIWRSIKSNLLATLESFSSVNGYWIIKDVHSLPHEASGRSLCLKTL